ncbi:MAG: DUF3822 family protein [Prevotellaceae bacterium]|jgi:hypothetical protein|nr:DUF3822 family protein [Prevotellaceae bacterium]
MSKEFIFTSPDFSDTNAANYLLSIRETDDCTLLTVVDTREKQCVALRRYPDKTLNDLVKSDSLLRLPCHSVVEICQNLPHALVPQNLFDENSASAYLPLDDLQQKRARTYWQTLPCYDAVSVMDVRRACAGRHFPAIHYRHPLALLAQFCAQHQTTVCYADYHGATLYLAAGNVHRLALANGYDCQTDDDVAYFVLSAYQHLRADVETAPLILLVDAARFTSLYTLLSMYIRHVQQVSPSSKCCRTVPDAAYYPTFALNLCVEEKG